MEDRQLAFETNLQNLDRNDWLGAVDDICDEFGFFEQLGDGHFAGFLEAGNNLLITFENIQVIQEHNAQAEPRGFAFARNDGWSHLALLSSQESWFRQTAVYDFFDRMTDDRFFEDFERIVFHGGDGGTAYAAAIYSVAAPGATVIALRPQATLSARTAGWDQRYKSARMDNFEGRYGYAPEMIDAAANVFIAYDPVQRLDAIHAALFRKPHVTTLPCPLLGAALDRAFDRMGIHDVLIKLAMDDALDGSRFRKLLRARRYDQNYTRSLIRQLIKTGHPRLAITICNYMLRRGDDAFFSKQLAKLQPNDKEKSVLRLS